MYIAPKKVVAVTLSASLILAACCSEKTYAGQVYDSSNTGIFDKVTEYLEHTDSTDPVSDLTDGLVSYDSLASSNTVSSEVVDAATESETEDGTLADEISTVRYSQFEGRAIATTSGQLNIRSEASIDSEQVGALERAGLCQVLEKGAEWTKISSGNCVGYVKTEYLAFGDAAGDWAKDHDVDKIATIDTTTLYVREEASSDSDCIGMVAEGDEYTILSTEDGWYEIRIDSETTGYISGDFVSTSFKTEPAKTVEEMEEEERIAEEKRRAEEEAAAAEAAANNDTSYSDSSSDDSSSDTSYEDTSYEDTSSDDSYDDSSDDSSDDTPSYSTSNGVSDLQQAVVDYAVQFVGNPYVYGGTSLTNGTDCSGFTMLVYAHFGISLPHGATSQSYYGTEVSLSDIEPGDLLFYPDDDGYGHVTIYMGNGQVVHASNSRDGIKISDYSYRTPTKAVRFFD